MLNDIGCPTPLEKYFKAKIKFIDIIINKDNICLLFVLKIIEVFIFWLIIL
jgi:hypothetical protein